MTTGSSVRTCDVALPLLPFVAPLERTRLEMREVEEGFRVSLRVTLEEERMTLRRGARWALVGGEFMWAGERLEWLPLRSWGAELRLVLLPKDLARSLTEGSPRGVSSSECWVLRGAGVRGVMGVCRDV